jgi:UDP-glucose 4-epimerase
MSKEGIDYFNIGTGKGYSVLEVVHAFEKATGKPLPYRIVERRPGDIATCYADPAKAEKELGWKAKYDINRMCEDAYRWQTMNPDGYGE